LAKNCLKAKTLRVAAMLCGSVAPQVGVTDADEIELTQSLQVADFCEEK